MIKPRKVVTTRSTRIKRSIRHAWLWAWSREWFAMLFFLVVVVVVVTGMM